jgi:Xaa-Pro aminopeptidase/Xaa-Pro dipeptidase
VASRDGQIALIVPEDEDEIARMSWADEVITYCPAPLDRLTTNEESVFEAFAALRKELGLTADRIGFEQFESFEPAGYAPSLFRGSAVRLLRRAFPAATLAPADELLAQMRSVKTAAEIEHIRRACDITANAFQHVASFLSSGLTEAQVAARLRVPLSSCLGDFQEVKRCDGFAYCMSGPNSAQAYGPYSRSRMRRIEAGDLVILRCHSYADGYWADIARTYFVGVLPQAKRRMFDAVLIARDAVLSAIRPGVKAAELDHIARSVLEARSLGAAFKHATGHGAGFGALDHTARPRLHPKSDDVLEPGMVLNVEPSVYIRELGGVRESSMVAVTENGVEILSPFHWGVDDATLN